MAEYCLNCFNKYNKTNYNEKEVTLKKDFCESCGEIKPCVMALRKKGIISCIKSSLQKQKNKT